MKNAEKLATSKKDLAFVYNRLGLIYDNKDDLDNALFYHSKHLSLSRELGNRREEAVALSNIAGVYRSKGDLDKALDYYEQSLKLKTDEKDKAPTLNNIAFIYRDKGDFPKAVEYFKKAIDIFERVGDYHRSGQTMLNLGDTYREMKDFENAWYYLNEGLKRVTKVGDKYWEATAYLYFGYYYLDTGDKKKAKEYFEKGLKLAKGIGSKRLEMEALFALAVLEAQKKTNLYGGIEVGSKGVKAMVVEVKEADAEGFYNVDEKFRKSVNTTIIAGVAEKGLMDEDAMNETVKVIKELMAEIEKRGVRKEDIFIVGSSAIIRAKNYNVFAQKVKEATQKDMAFINTEEEVFYNIIGSIPKKYRANAISVDIGSGNTKIGYLEGDSQRTVSFEIPYGTVSLGDKAKKENPSEKEYVNTLLKIASSDVAPKIKKEVSRKPPLLNRKYVFMNGGIVWAMVTLLYPEKKDSFVILKAEDINRFYNMLINKKEAVFNVDLQKIKDEDTRKYAEKQIQSVKDVFSIDNLIAGATILKTISDELKFRNKILIFSRHGSWLWGYIALNGIEKFETNK